MRISVSFFAFVGLLALAPAAVRAQPRPYIGYVYPAGGRQGTTFLARFGGQDLDDVQAVLVTGMGVTARVTENYWRLNLEEMQVLNEQLRVLRRDTLSAAARAELMESEKATNRPAITNVQVLTEAKKESARKLIADIERRTLEYVLTPASPAIASLVIVEVSVAADAEPGEREIRLVTRRGISNPLAFHVGQLPELSKKPMATATLQVLGKESQALRKRLPGEEEERITLPCTVNGQMASGEVNRYRFEARRGQRLVITTLGRQLVPFIADAVPGWFQPVLALYDPGGKEVAYGDDYRFKPDPTIFYEVARDGDYVCTIRDSLYRGREDFVYRITIGEVPFITSIFPLGGPAETPARPAIRGWNLGETGPAAAAGGSQPDICSLYVTNKGLISNRVPFGLGKLPETLEREPNGDLATAQKVMLPTIINGRIDKPGDRDVFQFTGKANDVVVAEVQARRLDSPLDSVITLGDAAGRLLALNDDHEDLASGLNTHQADSYLMAKLPADGRYFVQISDAARQGGEEYGYRLRLSAPQPDFDLRVVPSSVSLPARSNADLTMYVQRRDGFAEPVTVFLKDAVPGFSASPVTMVGTQTVARLTINTDLTTTKGSVALSVLGRATVAGQEIVHAAVPAEDRMQAFLWRHLVPARELRALVFEPSYEPPPKRLPPPRPPPVAATNAPSSTNVAAATAAPPADKPTFTKEQAAARLKLLKRLFEEGMFTDEFYLEKVAECEATE